jgi:hypothetical protein
VLAPISLQNLKVEVFQSATLRVFSSEGRACIAYANDLSDTTEESPARLSRRSSWKSDDSLVSPTALYHSFTTEDDHICALQGCIILLMF